MLRVIISKYAKPRQQSCYYSYLHSTIKFLFYYFCNYKFLKMSLLFGLNLYVRIIDLSNISVIAFLLFVRKIYRVSVSVCNRNRDKLGDAQSRHKAASIVFKSRAICAINLFYECHGYDIYYHAPFSHILCKPTTDRFYACYFIAVLGDSFLIKGTYTGIDE